MIILLHSIDTLDKMSSSALAVNTNVNILLERLVRPCPIEVNYIKQQL